MELSDGNIVQILILLVLAITAIISLVGVITTRKFRKESNRPRLWPTDIYLNPFDISPDKESLGKNQKKPLVVRLRRKTGERDPERWCLLTKQIGDEIRVRGQVNFKNGGKSVAQLFRIEQKIWIEGRPVSSPPPAEEIEFLCYPDQEFNVNFNVNLSSIDLKEGDLLYGIQWQYTDEIGGKFVEEAFFWYDVGEDKWWSNMNKVPWFKNLSKWDK